MTHQAHDTRGTYDVVLLVEQALSEADARQVVGLHEELDEAVRYHVLIPAEDAAVRVEAAMGSLSAGEPLGGPAFAIGDLDLAEVRREALAHAEAELAAAVARLQAHGPAALGQVVTAHPVDALRETVARVEGREAIVLTRPHVVAELFHVDWTSRARRHLGVPVLHLLEHEQA